LDYHVRLRVRRDRRVPEPAANSQAVVAPEFVAPEFVASEVVGLEIVG